MKISSTLHLQASETTHFYQGWVFVQPYHFCLILTIFVTFYFCPLKVCMRGAHRPILMSIAPKLFDWRKFKILSNIFPDGQTGTFDFFSGDFLRCHKNVKNASIFKFDGSN